MKGKGSSSPTGTTGTRRRWRSATRCGRSTARTPPPRTSTCSCSFATWTTRGSSSADAPGGPLPVRLLGRGAPGEDPRPPAGGEPGRLAEDALRAVEEAGKRGRRSPGARAGTGTTWPPSRSVRILRQVLSKFPPQLRPLDVVLLHGFILEQLLGISPEAVTAGQCVKYYKDPSKAAADLASGAIQVAFFMNAVTIPEFRRRLALRARPPAEVDLLLPEDRTGLLIFPVAADDRVPG